MLNNGQKDEEYERIAKVIDCVLIIKNHAKKLSDAGINIYEYHNSSDKILAEQGKRLVELIKKRKALTPHTIALCMAAVKRLRKSNINIIDSEEELKKFEEKSLNSKKSAAYDEVKALLKANGNVNFNRIQLLVGQKLVSWEDISEICGGYVKGIKGLEKFLEYKRDKSK